MGLDSKGPNGPRACLMQCISLLELKVKPKVLETPLAEVLASVHFMFSYGDV